MNAYKIVIHPNCLPPLTQSGAPIVIATLAPLAESIFNACSKNGIQVHAFCDSRAEKAQKTFCGLEVVQTRELAIRFPTARILVAHPDIREVARQLNAFGFNDVFSAADLLRGMNFQEGDSSYSLPMLKYYSDVYLRSHDNCFSTEERLYLKNVDMVITERCSLKCRHCANLMQYYINPKDMNPLEVIDSAERLCQAVDDIIEFRIIGGEPFMNPEWLNITKEILRRTYVRNIAFYTNATIVPPDLALQELVGKNIVFTITDYGVLSRSLKALTTKLDFFCIGYTVIKPIGWADCAGICRHRYSSARLEHMFRECCAKNLFTIIDGRFHRCPFAANLSNLGGIHDASDDYVDLLGKSDLNVTRNAIRALLTRQSFLASCDYCNGRDYSAPLTLLPAQQTEETLPYVRF